MGEGARVFGSADYNGEKIFGINEPCDIILTQWGKFSSTCLFQMHVKDMIVYELPALCSVCQNMRL